MVNAVFTKRFEPNRKDIRSHQKDQSAFSDMLQQKISACQSSPFLFFFSFIKKKIKKAIIWKTIYLHIPTNN